MDMVIVTKELLFCDIFHNSIQHGLLLLHFLLNCLMQIKIKAVDPLVIEDYSTESQFQGKHHMSYFCQFWKKTTCTLYSSGFYTACDRLRSTEK